MGVANPRLTGRYPEFSRRKESRKTAFERLFFEPAQIGYTLQMQRSPLRYCRECGGRLTYRLPDDGDTKKRAVCDVCATVHYENPLNVVGTVPFWGADGERVLLCKRNIEPRKGYWTLPAGFMELDETTSEGAARETIEEAGAQFELQSLFSIVNVRRVGQVHLFYRAKLLSEEFAPGHETTEAKLFAEQDIPWADLAFKTVKVTLEHYFSDRFGGAYGFHEIDV
jgi:ADP-ribose pyrophosphatase YjhB (NUDIX family)